MTIDKPVVGIATDACTGGYWLAAADGGFFSYNARIYGSVAQGATRQARLSGLRRRSSRPGPATTADPRIGWHYRSALSEAMKAATPRPSDRGPRRSRKQ